MDWTAAHGHGFFRRNGVYFTDGFGQAIEQADKAMYAQRNRVRSSSRVVEKGLGEPVF